MQARPVGAAFVAIARAGESARIKKLRPLALATWRMAADAVEKVLD
jgi:hypothetical protein